MTNIKPEHWSAARKEHYNFFKKQLEPLEKTKVIYDLGAGPTQFVDLFLQFKYVGVDFVKEGPDGLFPHVSIVADLTKTLPIQDKTADIVILSNTLEHIPTPEHLITECYRILKPDGILIGTVPWIMGIHQAPYDYNRYTHYQLDRMLTNAGFRDAKVETLGLALDTYNTIELKTWDYLRKSSPGLITTIIRAVRRIEMYFLRKIYKSIPASPNLTESYGFTAKKK